MWQVFIGILLPLSVFAQLSWESIELAKIGPVNQPLTRSIIGSQVARSTILLSEEVFRQLPNTSSLSSSGGTAYQEYRRQQYRERLRELIWVSILDFEVEQKTPGWQQRLNELGSYAAIYAIFWVSEHLLKKDMKSTTENPDYNEMYRDFYEYAQGSSIGFNIDWSWCQYTTKTLCSFINKYHPPVTDYRLEIEELPASWPEFRFLIEKRLQAYTLQIWRQRFLDRLWAQTEQATKPSLREKQQAQWDIYQTQLKRCAQQISSSNATVNTVNEDTCKLVTTERWGSEALMKVISQWWQRKQETSAWSKMLESLLPRYKVETNYPLCDQGDDFICNEFSQQELLELRRSSYSGLVRLVPLSGVGDTGN